MFKRSLFIMGKRGFNPYDKSFRSVSVKHSRGSGMCSCRKSNIDDEISSLIKCLSSSFSAASRVQGTKKKTKSKITRPSSKGKGLKFVR